MEMEMGMGWDGWVVTALSLLCKSLRNETVIVGRLSRYRWCANRKYVQIVLLTGCCIIADVQIVMQCNLC